MATTETKQPGPAKAADQAAEAEIPLHDVFAAWFKADHPTSELVLKSRQDLADCLLWHPYHKALAQFTRDLRFCGLDAEQPLLLASDPVRRMLFAAKTRPAREVGASVETIDLSSLDAFVKWRDEAMALGAQLEIGLTLPWNEEELAKKNGVYLGWKITWVSSRKSWGEGASFPPELHIEKDGGESKESGDNNLSGPIVFSRRHLDARPEAKLTYTKTGLSLPCKSGTCRIGRPSDGQLHALLVYLMGTARALLQTRADLVMSRLAVKLPDE